MILWRSGWWEKTELFFRGRIKEMIREEIEKNNGKQFDPKIADIFLNLLKEGKI